MQNHSKFAVTVRALIVDHGELLMVKHRAGHPYHALPGGRLEIDEPLRGGLTRELIEETAIKPDVGRLLFINDWVSPERHRVEFFFWVRNAAAYRHADPKQATHGFEISSLIFADATDPQFNLLPSFLRQRFPRLLELGEAYPTELVQSS
jgi:ADP-ribose pyrophosphatase YjhB (NUDIX family)